MSAITHNQLPGEPHPPNSLARREIGLALAWYIAGWIAVVIAITILMAVNGMAPHAIVSRLPRLLRWVSRSPLMVTIALVPYVVFLLVRSLVRAFRRGGPRAFALTLASRLVLPAAAFAALGLGYRAYRQEGPVAWRLATESLNSTGHAQGLGERDGKMRGVNLVAGRRAGEEVLTPLLRDNVEWIAVSPFGWQESLHGTEIAFHPEAGPFSESDSGIVSLTTMAHARGMRVMLKPHLWIMDGGGGSNLSDAGPTSEEHWPAWFASYRAFLMHHARLAERAGIDLLCIGAELKRATTSHPEAWRSMITTVRGVYHGRLTYAANWSGEAEQISFWDALDAIGVQAYYPLASMSSPGVSRLEHGWTPVMASLQSLHARWGKPIVFTEIGWKSTDDATTRPWEWTEDASQYLKRVSTRTQADAYEAFFDTVWRQPWFAGAFIWKWYANHGRAGGAGDIDFTPQNKPAEAVIARGFGSESTTRR